MKCGACIRSFAFLCNLVTTCDKIELSGETPQIPRVPAERERKNLEQGKWYAVKIDGKIRRVMLLESGLLSTIEGLTFRNEGTDPIAAWFDLHDDGAPYRCSSCEELRKSRTLIAVATPDGQSTVLCRDLDRGCLDPDWLKLAEYGGKL